MSDIISKRIKELRIENNLTQKQFGERLNVSQDTVSLWEKGKSLPSTEYVIEISKVFHVTSDYLLGLTDY